MVPSASIPAVRQKRSKLTETASQALSTAPIPVRGKAVNGVIAFFMALLSFRGISTPSLPAQGEQRRSSYFNIPRGNSTRNSPMLQFTEKIPPLRRPEIFDEFVKVDPAFGRQEDSQRQVEKD